MRKNVFKMVGVAMLLFTMNSCGDKTTTGEDADAPLVFSPLTVEQQKSTISNDGIALGDKMEVMKETPAIKTVEFLSSSDINTPSFSAPLRELRAGLLRNDVKAIETFNKQMTSPSQLESAKWGTHTWRESTQTYDFVKGIYGTVIVKFPADAASKYNETNNGTLTIVYVSSSVAVPENPSEKMPASLSVKLSVGTVEALSYQFTGAYKSDATPTLLSSTLVIGDFNWSAKATNNDKDVAAEFAFKHKEQVLLKYTVGVSGTLTVDAIKESKGPEDVFTSGYMSIQVMNTAIYGGIADFKTFAKGMDAIKPETITQMDEFGYPTNTYTVMDSAKTNQQVTLMNKHLKFYGYFVKENGKFADVEFYLAKNKVPDYSIRATLVYTQKSYNDQFKPAVYDYAYTQSVYNNSTQRYEYLMSYYAYETKIEYSSEPRLVLKDGSKVTDFAKYANDNFKTVIDKFQKMLPKN